MMGKTYRHKEDMTYNQLLRYRDLLVREADKSHRKKKELFRTNQLLKQTAKMRGEPFQWVTQKTIKDYDCYGNEVIYDDIE